MVSLPRSVTAEIVQCPHCGGVSFVRVYDWPEFHSDRWQIECARCGWRWCR